MILAWLGAGEYRGYVYPCFGLGVTGLPANRFNGFTRVRDWDWMRAPHYNHIVTPQARVRLFEIISENFMIDGGRPLRIMDEILEQYKWAARRFDVLRLAGEGEPRTLRR